MRRPGGPARSSPGRQAGETREQGELEVRRTGTLRLQRRRESYENVAPILSVTKHEFSLPMYSSSSQPWLKLSNAPQKKSVLSPPPPRNFVCVHVFKNIRSLPRPLFGNSTTTRLATPRQTFAPLCIVYAWRAYMHNRALDRTTCRTRTSSNSGPAKTVRRVHKAGGWIPPIVQERKGQRLDLSFHFQPFPLNF